MSGDTFGRQRPDWLALAAIAVTIAVHMLIKLATGKISVPFIAGAVGFWTLFVVARAWQDSGVFHRWGFRRENLLPASAAALSVFVAAALAMALFAQQNGYFEFPLHTLALFIVYPMWGLIQQFLALGIVVGNLQRLAKSGWSRAALVVGTAALFAAIHFYDWRLAAATFAFELVAIPLYLRYHNLWPLGILQGWLGALFYLWILREDLWVESFGR